MAERSYVDIASLRAYQAIQTNGLAKTIGQACIRHIYAHGASTGAMIAEATGIQKSSISGALKWLRDAGVLKRIELKGCKASNGRYSGHYHIICDDWLKKMRESGSEGTKKARGE